MSVANLSETICIRDMLQYFKFILCLKLIWNDF